MAQIFSPKTLKKLVEGNDNETSLRLRRRYDKKPDLDDERSTNEGPLGLDSSTLDAAISGVMVRSKWNIKRDSSSSKHESLDGICSICLGDLPESGDGTLVTPCLCTGFRSHQHKSCIEEWIEQTGVVSCPFCNVRYDFTRSRKGFLDYVKDCELQEDFLINLAASIYAFYLFLVGLFVCYSYLFSSFGCGSHQVQEAATDLSTFNSIEWRSWADLEQVLGCRQSIEAFNQLHSWPSIVLFGTTCVGTVLLLIGITSLCLNMTIRHYVRYILWAQTNCRVTIRPYGLEAIR